MIKTERLTILPLSYDELKQYVKNRVGSVVNDEDEKWVSDNLIANMEQASDEDKVFWTIWVILTADNEVVGDMGFHGVPTPEGQVEVGYTIISEFRGNGYATEAVKGILRWCKRRENISFVYAATEGDNVASQRVLSKNDFQYNCQKNGMEVWRKQIKF